MVQVITETPEKRPPQRRRGQRVWDFESEYGIQIFLEVITRRYLLKRIDRITAETCISAARLALQAMWGVRRPNRKKTVAGRRAEDALRILQGGGPPPELAESSVDVEDDA